MPTGIQGRQLLDNFRIWGVGKRVYWQTELRIEFGKMYRISISTTIPNLWYTRHNLLYRNNTEIQTTYRCSIEVHLPSWNGH